MRAERAEAKIDKLITDVIKRHFAQEEVVRVFVERSLDYDDDPIFNIQVIVDKRKGGLDAKRAAGLVRHIRSCLAEQDEFGFPLVSFVSKTEAGKLSAEAA